MLDKLLQLITQNGQSTGIKPSLDGILEKMDRHLDNFDTLVQPAPESKPRTPFDSDVPMNEMSMMKFTFKQRLKILGRGIPLFYNMQRSTKLYDGKFRPRKTQASSAFIQALEARAYRLGVKDIRYVKVPPNAIFKGKGIPHPYAIVFTVEMQKEPIETSPSFESQFEVIRGYKNLAAIGNHLAFFMRRKGYAAYPGTALGGVTDYVHLAELAGLGAIGYHGLLISPGEGARIRINTIYTNIDNLPIQDVNEHLWIRDFCAMCKKCVRSCPVEAIYPQPQARGDGGMQCIDHASCREYFSRNYGCAVCLAICPFSHTGYDKIKERFKGNPSAPHFEIPIRT